MKTALATELSQQFPGIQIEWYEMSDLSNLGVPVEINLGFESRITQNLWETACCSVYQLMSSPSMLRLLRMRNARMP